MKVTRNPYLDARVTQTRVEFERLRLQIEAWDVGYRQALLDLTQHCLVRGLATLGEELLALEAKLHG